jgi:hypothetical protein
MLKLRMIGINDYSVLESGRRIGRIRLATEHTPCVWLWSVTIHLGGGLPTGSSQDLNTAKAEGDEPNQSPMEDDPIGQCNPLITPTKTVTTIDRERATPPWRLSWAGSPVESR